MIRTHNPSGWTRLSVGFGNWHIEPTDDSGPRVVAFMSAGSWANLPNDHKDDQNKDRVVLISGAPLPTWAQTWLENANARSCENAREAMAAAFDDADDNYYFGRDSGW